MSNLNLFLLVTALVSTSGTVGYFIGKRGLEGTKSDLQDIRDDISRLKTSIVNAVKR